MKKNTLVIGIFILLGLFACRAFAESSVWKVSRGENYFYVGGTIHVLTDSDHPLPEEFDIAYRDASTIVFETDLLAAQSSEFQAQLMGAMTYGDTRTLASELAPTTYRSLEEFMASRKLPIQNFSGFQPWGVALMITMHEYQLLGMLPNYGVDVYFSGLALTDHKVVSSLETIEDQLGVLASMAELEPNLAIEYTLLDLERLPDIIALLLTSWRSGDLNALSEAALLEPMKEEFPEMYNTMITQRNNAWMKQLVQLMDDSIVELVLVGALHLPGTDGLLHQLRSRGFTVEQLGRAVSDTGG